MDEILWWAVTIQPLVFAFTWIALMVVSKVMG